MIRKIALSLLLLCSQISPIMALSVEDLPSSFAIKEQKCQTDSCYDFSAYGQKIGAFRRASGTSGSFAFFDEKNNRQFTLKFVKASWGNFNFDIYDQERVLVAKAQLFFERKTGRFVRFTLLNVDEHTVLATGVSNILGTTHTIYRGTSWDVLATMQRPFFTWSRDSNVTIQDKSQFSDINPNILVAVMALYCIHNTSLKIDVGDEDIPVPLFQELQSNLKKLAVARAAETATEVVTSDQMQAAADLLNQRYREVYSDDTNLSEEEKIKQFVAFGCGLIQSRTLSPIEEQAMLQFLITRLGS
jgi:hypothetical protein